MRNNFCFVGEDIQTALKIFFSLLGRYIWIKKACKLIKRHVS